MSDMVQLMLIVDGASVSVETVDATLKRFDVACVLIQPSAPGADQDLLVATIQRHQAAVVLALSEPDFAQSIEATGQADGCHLVFTDDLEDRFNAARMQLGLQAIIGAAPGPTRHMAMSLAEAGADYVAYTVTDALDDPGAAKVEWWSEIFQTPVVAFTDGSPATCSAAIDAGPPDFLAVPLNGTADFDRIEATAQLIAERGHLPIADKNAK